MILLSQGKADIIMFLEGTQWAINLDNFDPHPYILTLRFWFLKSFFEFACPLPQRIASFYNVITPLSLQVWMLVTISVVLISFGFVVINQCYKSLSSHSSKWKW